MSRLPTDRPPTPPGKVLLHELLEPMGLSQSAAADAIGVPFQRLDGVVKGRRAMTLSTALRLACAATFCSSDSSSKRPVSG